VPCIFYHPFPCASKESGYFVHLNQYLQKLLYLTCNLDAIINLGALPTVTDHGICKKYMAFYTHFYFLYIQQLYQLYFVQLVPTPYVLLV
jgi:hypothetical protein